MIVLIVIALLLVVAAASQINQATFGVGLMGAACFVAILARLAQAHTHHREIMALYKVNGDGKVLGARGDRGDLPNLPGIKA
jgi:hypothetical protein